MYLFVGFDQPLSRDGGGAPSIAVARTRGSTDNDRQSCNVLSRRTGTWPEDIQEIAEQSTTNNVLIEFSRACMAVLKKNLRTKSPTYSVLLPDTAWKICQSRHARHITEPHFSGLFTPVHPKTEPRVAMRLLRCAMRMVLSKMGGPPRKNGQHKHIKRIGFGIFGCSSLKPVQQTKMFRGLTVVALYTRGFSMRLSFRQA